MSSSFWRPLSTENGSDWPDSNDPVRVSLKLRAHGMTQMIEIHTHSFPAGKLEGGDQITISRDNDNRSNQIPQCQPSYVQPDSKVNPLLFDRGNEVASLWRSWICLHTS